MISVSSYKLTAMTDALLKKVLGCDFTSSPSKRKPITCAWGHLQGDTLHITALQPCTTMNEFAAVLAAPKWTGGFDIPFGLPRELLAQLNWPMQWLPAMRHYASLPRAQIREQFKAFCDARPVGGKFAHRATDLPAKSSPSMKWVNPPVAYMLHAGVPALLDAGVSLAGLHSGDAQRIALEAYPAFAARTVIGNTSYKSDDKTKQNAQRAEARAALISGIHSAAHPHLKLNIDAPASVLQAMQDDASGDTVDAVLCALQAAWALGQPNYGLPKHMDTLEGWIVSVPASP
jgi:hypothetical protein